MENSLASAECEACTPDAQRLSLAELDRLLPQIPSWVLVSQEGVLQLSRLFEFKNFVEAQAFANKVADLAEENGHHPALLLEWGRVTVRWWTHKIRGLHHNDIVMAAKTDKI